MRSLQIDILNLLTDMKAMSICELDLRQKATFTDTLIIATGNSQRHVKAIAENLLQCLKKQSRVPLSIQGTRSGLWVVLDYSEVVVHLMLQEIRDFYMLEKLWQFSESSVKPATA